MKYTVILLYPDYMSEIYGQETYCDSVEAADPAQAVALARDEVKRIYPEELQDPEDMFLLALFEGAHPDIKHQAEAEEEQ